MMYQASDEGSIPVIRSTARFFLLAAISIHADDAGDREDRRDEEAVSADPGVRESFSDDVDDQPATA